MILVTVGTQLPFDRLIKAVDDWAVTHPGEEVFAQTGKTSYQPQAIGFAPSVTPEAFKDLVFQCEFVIAHAGMGSILMGLEFAKPVIVVPRLAAYGEHRNDHQLATVSKFAHLPQITAAEPDTLATAINRVRQGSQVASGLSPYASPELLRAVQNFAEVM